MNSDEILSAMLSLLLAIFIIMNHLKIQQQLKQTIERLNATKPAFTDSDSFTYYKSSIMQKALTINQAKQQLILLLDLLFGPKKIDDGRGAKFQQATNKKIAAYLNINESQLSRLLKKPELADSNPPSLEIYHKVILLLENKIRINNRYVIKNIGKQIPYSNTVKLISTLFLIAITISLGGNIIQWTEMKTIEEMHQKALLDIRFDMLGDNRFHIGNEDQIERILDRHSPLMIKLMAEEAKCQIDELKKSYNKGDVISDIDKTKTAVRVVKQVSNKMTQARANLRDMNFYIGYSCNLVDVMDSCHPTDSLFIWSYEDLALSPNPPPKELLFDAAAWEVLQYIFELPQIEDDIDREIEIHVRNVQLKQQVTVIKEAKVIWKKEINDKTMSAKLKG